MLPVTNEYVVFLAKSFSTNEQLYLFQRKEYCFQWFAGHSVQKMRSVAPFFATDKTVYLSQHSFEKYYVAPVPSSYFDSEGGLISLKKEQAPTKDSGLGSGSDSGSGSGSK